MGVIINGGGGSINGVRTSDIQNPPTRNVISSTTLSFSDYRINVMSTANPFTMTIPAGVVDYIGKTYEIVDCSGGAGDIPITIDTAGAETIEGMNEIHIVEDYGSVMLVSDGTSWNIV